MADPRLSIVVPVYNESGSLGELYARLAKVLAGIEGGHEIVFVDDGSTDGSADALRRLTREDPHVKAVFLSRNFNQHAAIAAGFSFARGARIVLMDADLQDEPEDIPRLLEAADRGYDVVYGVREVRADSMFRKVHSRLFFSMFHFFSGLRLPEGIATYRLVSRRFADAFNRLPERNRFTAGMMAWLGFPVTTVPVGHGRRKEGRSSYTPLKLLRLALDAIFSFSDYPMKTASHIGIAMALVSFLVGLIMLYRKLTVGVVITGWASLVVSLFFLAGLQLFFLGVIGEYVARIFRDVQNRPVFVVRETLNL